MVAVTLLKCHIGNNT